MGSFPEQVRVRYADVVEPLRALLAPRGVSVEYVERLAHLEPAAMAFSEHMAGTSHWPPVCIAGSWSRWRLAGGNFRELFMAAGEFWRRAPWRFTANLRFGWFPNPASRPADIVH